MGNAKDSPWKYIVLWLRLVFAVHLIYSGMAYALGGWVPVDMTVGKVGSGTFMNMLNDVGMYAPVKYLEIITGIMLLFNIAVPLALVLELPITIVIFFLNVFVEGQGRHLYTGPQELFLNASLMFAYGGHYVGMLRLKAEPWWLWDGFKKTAPTHQQRAASNDLLFVAVVIGALVAAVLLASYLLGPVERRLPPRDYIPLVIAGIVMIVALFRDRSASN